MSDQTIASAPTTTDADSTEFPGRGVAQVIVDIDAPHLDEPYDYAVPTEFRDTVRVGSQVQVRFGRRRVSGYVVGLSASSSFSGKLAPILRVVTPLPVLSKALLETINYLSLRYCATRSQLLSFVVPTRRARVEKSFEDAIATARSAREGIFQEPATALLPPSQVERKVITALPGDRQKMLTNLVSEIAALGATALVLAPTAASSQQICGELEQSPGLRVGHIDAEQSADRRYRVYLQALLGRFDVLVGSRSAVWTPLPNLHTIVIWDDGDDRYREQRAPRLDALDVAVARSHVEHVALVCLSYARSIKAQALVETGWARSRRRRPRTPPSAASCTSQRCPDPSRRNAARTPSHPPSPRQDRTRVDRSPTRAAGYLTYLTPLCKSVTWIVSQSALVSATTAGHP